MDSGEEDEGFNMRDLTSFEWDTMYQFIAYQDVYDQCEEYELTCGRGIPNTIEYRETATLLLFVEDKEAVSYVEFYGGKVYFSQSLLEKGVYPPSEAVFRMEVKSSLSKEGDYVKLVPVDS